MSVYEAFQQLKTKMNNEPEGIQKLNAVYQFDLDEASYQIYFQHE